ncbi:Pleiotropic regulatory protein [uncultured Gammaproteobacteria bacterium]|jgi:dTDP-4-amino-4,6-dideoxygalactose transaminase|uniref:Pleiotropic regulatory protein n=3 Tax=sulfur-oxidizing symbionts TaxID=32036 RepID=A0ACA8ZRW8_9GAMM|nr:MULTISPECIES: DegT/DnrJ/EryC1/StrS family aminotransferase [sulfur-oxidizing symbionts]CAC9497030.1 Pleiotropic regulatory protein [uncultured Gammaproteobacteria bacterium]CAB5502368.1 Pleiotropic regulatory protein [Bathymodiolus azoricus thioautotrophic gill symbiont]CAB5506966.1 Pleiotropic regulatory protein [Bathymodiolus thermophilus thioautotrophic gill symbiont]CAC9498167.1 Pleiotropic regulatory protein [uncultured Gammaproteobacteria bacterium]CAC9523352.1 Pleiotropic regulatory 
MSLPNVPFFEYPRLWSDDREEFLSIIDSVSSAGGFILQKAVLDFEVALANYTGANYSVGVGNATDGMEIFLEAIGIKQGDEVIISSHTMLATASAIKVAGGVPIPVDIGNDNLIGIQAIEDAITPNTVGIMPTQLNGRVCDMDGILAIAKKYGLFVVEDAAQALGAKYKDQHAGTFGLASDISFFPAKVLGCFGDAGAVLVNDKALYHKVYQMHDHGRDVDGKVKCWGRNSRLDNVQAAILSHKLKTYDSVIARRREVAQMYQDHLGHLEELQLPAAPSVESDNFDVYQNYELQADSRDELKAYLSGKNIGTLVQWGGVAIHQLTQLGFNQVLPNTDRFFQQCIMLPMNVFISNSDVDYICEMVTQFYKK